MMARQSRRLLAVALVSGVVMGACMFQQPAEQLPAEQPSAPSPPADVSGMWTGTFGAPGTNPAGVRFVLEEAQGVLKGRVLLEDPVSKNYIELGNVTGRRTAGGNAAWELDSHGLSVSGTFDQNHFAGKLSFPAVDDDPSYEGDLVLDR